MSSSVGVAFSNNTTKAAERGGLWTSHLYGRLNDFFLCAYVFRLSVYYLEEKWRMKNGLQLRLLISKKSERTGASAMAIPLGAVGIGF